jgi:pimeloyl-ACP methyl ester carboxylesterase
MYQTELDTSVRPRHPHGGLRSPTSGLRPLAALLLLVLSSDATAAEPPEKTSKPNVATPTLGGMQFWTDELLFRDWRIQRNVLTGNYRLLDESDVRRAWGSFADCRAKLDEIKLDDLKRDKSKRDRSLETMRGKVVILLHGLGRTRSSTRHLAKFLSEQSDFTVLQFGYASTRADVAEHAKSLARAIENLGPVEEIDFVAHSLGNLVVRHYLGDEIERTEGRRADPRIKRIVMLAPPNNGAKLAQLLGDNKLFKSIAGPPGSELGRHWTELEKHLAVPACEFGVIAGGRGEEHGRNPLLQSDDDLIVTVSETKLPGAQDFLVLPALHTFIMDEPKVQEATLRFLLHGYFESEADRHPLAHDEANP